MSETAPQGRAPFVPEVVHLMRNEARCVRCGAEGESDLFTSDPGFATCRANDPILLELHAIRLLLEEEQAARLRRSA